MMNALSRNGRKSSSIGGPPIPVLKMAKWSVATAIANNDDLLDVFPTEVRLMVFEELLILWPKTVFRGGRQFGPLDKNEFEEDVSVPWQILLTCRKYFEEAVPILYGGNKLVFCTGAMGKPGMFWRFPVRPYYMRHLTGVGIYYRANDPSAQASQRVAHFIKAITRLSTNLQELSVVVSSDRHHEAACPWDILFCDHPVCKALDKLVQVQMVKRLKLRIHDGAKFYPSWAHYMDQEFNRTGRTEDRSITFTQSCSCPSYNGDNCTLCEWPKANKDNKPIEVIVHPAVIEADEDAVMECQLELLQRGVFTNETEKEDTEDETRLLVVDEYEEMRMAFDSGLCADPHIYDSGNVSDKFRLLDGQRRHWRGPIQSPEVYLFRQKQITEFFKFIGYSQYIETIFRVVN